MPRSRLWRGAGSSAVGPAGPLPNLSREVPDLSREVPDLSWEVLDVPVGGSEPAAGGFRPVAGGFEPATGGSKPAAGGFGRASGSSRTGRGRFQTGRGRFCTTHWPLRNLPRGAGEVAGGHLGTCHRPLGQVAGGSSGKWPPQGFRARFRRDASGGALVGADGGEAAEEDRRRPAVSAVARPGRIDRRPLA